MTNYCAVRKNATREDSDFNLINSVTPHEQRRFQFPRRDPMRIRWDKLNALRNQNGCASHHFSVMKIGPVNAEEGRKNVRFC
jgi:hypothetical protein